MNVGENIKTYRLKNGLTQRELGELLGVSQQFITRIEKNKNSPTLTTLEKLSDALNTSVHLLLGEFKENISITTDNKELLNNYSKLNDEGKKEAIKRVTELTEIKKYID